MSDRERAGHEISQGRTESCSPDGVQIRLTAEEQKILDDLVVKNKSTAAAGNGSGQLSADARALPRLRGGLIIALALTWLFSEALASSAAGIARELWIHLPMQLYWTFCLYRISQVMAHRCGNRPPIGELQLAVLSIISFICMPTFGGYQLARWLDPFFWCWTATQIAWAARFGYCLERTENPERGFCWRLPLAFSAGTNAYILLGLVYPLLLSVPLVFNSLWFISQFWCILFLTLTLSGKLEEKKESVPAVQERSIQVSGKDVVIRYRPFVAVERWLRERLSTKGLRQGSRPVLVGRYVFMWFVAPAMLILSAIGVVLFSIFSGPGMVAPAAAAVGASSAAGNTCFMTVFLSSLLGLAAAGHLLYCRQPTHIGFGRQGFRFLWRHKFRNHDGPYVDWSAVYRIALVRPAGKTSPLDDRLCFYCKGGKLVNIKMGAIDSVDDRECVLKAIRKWAPDTARDPAVEQALQPPPDYSYTELWLQALSAPPKRERLQPLLEGVCLRDGRYEVQRTLGVGGQGQAYIALDKVSGRTTVLKEFILPVYVDVNVRRGALEQFENEARVLRQLDHPKIVKMLDFFVEDHRAYLVLEHIHGGSLREIVKNHGRLLEKQVRMLAVQMCEILAYLHGLNPPVVHRDFTPDNLILSVDGTLKLIESNVARQEVESTTSGTVVGKHAYIPPEQFRGMPETQSDIYAMGATLFFLLTGQDPEPISVSHPRNVCADVSESLNEIVQRATALELDKRYKVVSDLASDMGAIDVPKLA